eukprot:COSAG06_NODE_35914_length_454_cov_0.707042_1_plen_59_part_10
MVWPPLASKHRNGKGTAAGPPGADSRAVSRCASCGRSTGGSMSRTHEAPAGALAGPASR